MGYTNESGMHTIKSKIAKYPELNIIGMNDAGILLKVEGSQYYEKDANQIIYVGEYSREDFNLHTASSKNIAKHPFSLGEFGFGASGAFYDVANEPYVFLPILQDGKIKAEEYAKSLVQLTRKISNKEQSTILVTKGVSADVGLIAAKFPEINQLIMIYPDLQGSPLFDESYDKKIPKDTKNEWRKLKLFYLKTLSNYALSKDLGKSKMDLITEDNIHKITVLGGATDNSKRPGNIQELFEQKNSLLIENVTGKTNNGLSIIDIPALMAKGIPVHSLNSSTYRSDMNRSAFLKQVFLYITLLTEEAQIEQNRSYTTLNKNKRYIKLPCSKEISKKII